ncbi:hypothetical protein GWK18_02895 [Kocuria sp. JC486]|uniref:hypothetical protein n=1 Tax=Kocuria sp. JC486 TaxID=1970736 RepID=UPI001420CBC9|nr:hypothetical protein [Kocuria sp. JC486]NHU84553.1 hypothetical protein [Kocuria sp. JC486]
MTSANDPAERPAEEVSDGVPRDRSRTPAEPADSAAQDTPTGVSEQPDQGARPASRLSTVGELVEAGGNRGALGILVYLVIGTAFWSLVGFLLDYLVGTQWLVLLGAGLGLAAGVILAYLHLQAGLKDQ